MGLQVGRVLGAPGALPRAGAEAGAGIAGVGPGRLGLMGDNLKGLGGSMSSSKRLLCPCGMGVAAGVEGEEGESDGGGAALA